MTAGSARRSGQRGARAPWGFSAIELMVVVAIVALLMAIGIPSYQSFMMKSRRTEAKELLYTAAQRQQQFFTQNNVYTNNAATLGVATSSANGYYTLSIAAGPTGSINTSYAMSATPVAGSSQADDSDCGTFNINSLGLKTVSGSRTTPPCW